MRGTSVIPARKGGCRRRLLCDYATSKVSQEASIGLPRAFCCHVLDPLVVPRLERTFCALVLQGCFGSIPWNALAYETLFFQARAASQKAWIPGAGVAPGSVGQETLFRSKRLGP